MIRLNGVEYAFRQGLTLAEVVNEHNLTHAKVDFDGCLVVIGSAAIPAEQARARTLSDNEEIYIVPKLDGG